MNNNFKKSNNNFFLQKSIIQQFNAINQSNMPPHIRIPLLQSFLALLKQKQELQRSKLKQNLSTSISEDQSSLTNYQNQIEELEEKIIQKKAIKIQLNEEIEANEEQLFQIQGRVEEKQEYDYHLRKVIKKRMGDIEKRGNVDKVNAREEVRGNQKSYLNKSVKAVSGIFCGLFS